MEDPVDQNNDRKMGETKGYQKFSIVKVFLFSYCVISKINFHYTLRYNDEFRK